MRELIGEPGPLVDFFEQVRNFNGWIHTAKFPIQFLGLCGDFARERCDAQLAVFKADAVTFAVSGTIGELLEIEVGNLGCLGKVGCAIGRVPAAALNRKRRRAMGETAGTNEQTRVDS
ncbi:hypothetical protein OIU34_35005 [Pararhizobium sp. BT-229]|nr:hypothetical protein [Pararhizobium sp. BT-229]MCV9967043.1 hypothetical protein [Pararhizobium sp. BT-229]